MLESGSYTLYIDYESSVDRSFSIGDHKKDIFLYPAKGGKLRSYNNVEMYKFRTSSSLDQFTISIASNSFQMGYMRLNSISIVPNNESFKRLFVLLFLGFLIMDTVFIILFRNHKINIKTVAGLSGIIFLSSLPLFVSGLVEVSHDLLFHLMRLESLYIDFKRSPVLPVKINSSYIFNYGYPVSVFYGDIYLYPFAFMRMVRE
ncbi:MAG: hypothetical protein K6E98_07395 [Lachnospiraceae bacterium]|nr:hypothetical protein [Lachnospiraceae bacterium]